MAEELNETQGEVGSQVELEQAVSFENKTECIDGVEHYRTIYAGGRADHIIVGPEDDVIEVKYGTTYIDGGAGSNLVQLHGRYGDYHIEEIGEGYVVTDKIPKRDGTVVLKNIQELVFSDAFSINLTPMVIAPVVDSLRTNKYGELFDRIETQIISASQLLTNDYILNAQLPVKIDEVSDAKGGNVVLNADGEVLFTPDSKFAGIMQFKYSICDAKGNSFQVTNYANDEKIAMRATAFLLTPDIPSDSLITQQWYLSSANIIPVWRDYTGKGIRIGLFDPRDKEDVGPEVFDYTHPDLVENVEPMWFAAQKAKGVLPTTFAEHATSVAGVMVAAKNGEGMVGVAPDAKIISYSVDPTFKSMNALGYMSNTDIVNHSWLLGSGFGKELPSAVTNFLLAATHYAASNGRGGLGTVIVCGAGNARERGGSAQISLLNNNRFSVQVGAINVEADLSTLQFSQVSFSSPGASILVSAPGSHILSTSHVLKNHYKYVQGTSYATPTVSGIVALILEANPYLGYRDVQHILLLSARRVNGKATVWKNNHARYWNGGGMHVSHDYGFGEVDALAAVRLAETWWGKNTAVNLWEGSGKFTDIPILPGGKIISSATSSNGHQVEHVEVDLDLSFSNLSDVIVKLISPKGTESLLLNRNEINPENFFGNREGDSSNIGSDHLNYRFMTTHAWGEKWEGDWQLEVMDIKKASSIKLHSWTLHLYGSEKTNDNIYFYTDEYADLVNINPQRGILDDAVNGSPGGRNTIHAAAVSGDVNINLLTGESSINGQNLTVVRPHAIHNLIGGDGDDTLIANHAGALLDGGRGQNILVGGDGADIFIIHQRPNGLDALFNFDIENGDKIYLVGCSGTLQEVVTFATKGSHVYLYMPNKQRILVQNQANNVFELKQAVIMQEKLKVPKAYIDSKSDETTLVEDSGIVWLSGGSRGTRVDYEEQKVYWGGKIYDRSDVTVNQFTVMPLKNEDLEADDETIDYGNTVRGFKAGSDQIDLRRLGVHSFDDLILEKREWRKDQDRDIAIIHGTEILSHSLGDERGPAALVYLDAVEPYQITESNFIFAKEAPKPIEMGDLAYWDDHLEASTGTLIQQMATAKEPSILPSDTGASGTDFMGLDLAAGNDTPQFGKKPNAA